MITGTNLFRCLPADQLDAAIARLEATVHQMRQLANGDRISRAYVDALDQARRERERRSV
jgi:hypothetical protein